MGIIRNEEIPNYGENDEDLENAICGFEKILKGIELPADVSISETDIFYLWQKCEDLIKKINQLSKRVV